MLAYEPAVSEGPLRQGEILSGVVESRLVVESLADEADLRILQRVHPFAIVITQDCDLDWDYRSRKTLGEETPASTDEKEKLEAKMIPSILLLEMVDAPALRGTVHGRLWNTIKTNKNERYQFIEGVPQSLDLLSEGLPELGLDFKRYFSVPAEELYWQIINSRCSRRTRLVSPYTEHLSQRFSAFLSRVALPMDYESMPEG